MSATWWPRLCLGAAWILGVAVVSMAPVDAGQRDHPGDAPKVFEGHGDNGKACKASSHEQFHHNWAPLSRTIANGVAASGCATVSRSFVRLSSRALIATRAELPDMASAAISGLSCSG